MKARGIVIIDYDLPGGFKDAAQEEAKLQKAIDTLVKGNSKVCLLYTSPSPRDRYISRMPSSA